MFRGPTDLRNLRTPLTLPAQLRLLGSQAANSHVHWHVAPLPKGVPLERQQYHALMHENGIVAASDKEQEALANALRQEINDVAQ